MNTQELATRIRKHVLVMANRAGTSHVGSCLSCADILATLYGQVMRYRPQEPDWESRDRFIMSKGHAGSALYAVLAECGFFPVSELDTHCQPGSRLLGHASHKVPGVEVSTGSLGHGLSIGCGMAMALRGNGNTESRVFVLLGDGDLNEGSTWEAIMFAGHHRLDNLTVIVDYNRLQAMGSSSSIISLGGLTEKIREFGWAARAVDGHSHQYLLDVLPRTPIDHPYFIQAYTVKGKGVSFMEDRAEWHYRCPSGEELEKALEELG